MTLSDALKSKALFINHEDRVAFYASSRERLEEAFDLKHREMGVHYVVLGKSRGYDVVAVSDDGKDFVNLCVKT